jgi:hypothetical protein
MNAGVAQRLGIRPDLDPFESLRWEPSAESLDQAQQQMNDSIARSSLPAAVKDALADKHYDRSKPYNQELVRFITDSTLIQMVLAMKGAARALRNSDHVDPEAKRLLLEEVIRSWTRVCQVMFLVSPVLAQNGTAAHEGMGFALDNSFGQFTSFKERWNGLLTVIAENVVRWFQEDLFSKKMGALLINYAQSRTSSLESLLMLMVLAKQRPPSWDKAIERFIVSANKNSFVLNRIYLALESELSESFAGEGARQQLRRLSAMAVGKHFTGAKRPNVKLIEKTSRVLDLHRKSAGTPDPDADRGRRS